MDFKKVEKKFLDFFVKHNHLLLKSTPLIPEEYDPSSLFINSGMHPLKKYFLGIENPPKKTLCSSQRCFRTVDIDDVGSNGRTLTFFYMLGSWSVGDYWKEKAVELAYDLLVNGYKLDKDKLWASVFKGDKNLKKDIETIDAWKKVGMKKIVELSAEHNFWSAGPTGPCGTCTEVYYDQGKKLGCGKKSCKPGCDCDRFLEIWNAGVFIEYNRDEKGKLCKLPIKSVDTGAGLERISAVLQKKDSVFEIDMFLPILKEVERISKKDIVKNKRIICDHARACVFLINDGVRPSKMDRGYILRRIIRRIVRAGNTLEIGNEDILKICEKVFDIYPLKNKKEILFVIKQECDKFSKTLQKGIKRLDHLMNSLKKKEIPGIEAFHLYDTYGFPIELTKEIASERGFKIDERGYEKEFKKHQEVSRADLGKFKGGLADESEMTIKYHTVTHLLHQALRDVLGDHVKQKGSNITSERLRFDFTHDRKMTSDEIKKVEDIVNKKIKESLEVKKEEMSVDEAKKKGAIGLFEYGKKVSFYSIGKYSKEICGGPHVKNTKELGKFKILKEESSAAGVRRIKAKLE